VNTGIKRHSVYIKLQFTIVKSSKSYLSAYFTAHWRRFRWCDLTALDFQTACWALGVSVNVLLRSYMANIYYPGLTGLRNPTPSLPEIKWSHPTILRKVNASVMVDEV